MNVDELNESFTNYMREVEKSVPFASKSEMKQLATELQKKYTLKQIKEGKANGYFAKYNRNIQDNKRRWY